MGWGQEPPKVTEARLNNEIVKRGVRIDQLEKRHERALAILNQDWRGRYAQDLVTALQEVL